MAKARARRATKGFTLPVAVIAGFGPLVIYGMNDLRTGGVPSLLDGVSRRLTGFGTEGSGGLWEPKHLSRGLLPILGGLAVHKIAGRMGINRALANAGIPFLRV
jgi:hypothetical protein